MVQGLVKIAHFFKFLISSVIRQKDSNLKMRVTKKQSMPNFPKNDHLVPPDKRKCVSGGKKCSFFQKFALLLFSLTPVLRFTLLL